MKTPNYAEIISEFAREAERPPEPIGAVLRCINDIPAQKLSWLWPGRIPLGKLTLFSGDPGLGKSLTTLDIAARVTCKTPWPDEALNEKSGSVLLLSSEDDVADTVRPRLEVANADLTRIHILQMVRRQKPNGDAALECFNLKDDITALQDAIAKVGDVRLVIIDPLSAYMGDTDSHVNAKVRAVLLPLAQLAQDLRVAIVLIDHLNKSNVKAIYRSSGSIAFVAAARSAWCFGQDPNDPQKKLMVPAKVNLAPGQQGLSYRVERSADDPDVPVISWGEAVTVNADAILQPEESGERNERLEATEFLKDRLSSGPVSAKQIQDEARSAGFSSSTLRRARESLGIKSKKDAFNLGWSWEIPVPNEWP